MTTWEYWILELTLNVDSRRDEVDMDTLGEIGWEAFAVSGGRVFFKRRSVSVHALADEGDEL